MKPFVHVGMIYDIFEKIIKNTDHWVEVKTKSAYGLDKKIIKERLIQKIVVLTLDSFVRKNATSYFNGKSLSPSEIQLFHGGMWIDTKSGKISLSKKLFFRCLSEFFYEWSAAIIFNLKGLIKKSVISEPAILVFGVPAEAIGTKSDDNRFSNFCKEGPVLPLRESETLIIQTTKLLDDRGKLTFYKRPVIKLLEKSNLSVWDRSKLFLQLLIDPVIFFYKIICNPYFVLLGRDLGLISTVRFLAYRKKIKNIIITNSNVTDQQLWMRESVILGFKVHKVHYSQNSRPLVYKLNNLSVPHPFIKYVHADEHWVWTEGYKRFLQDIGYVVPINVVGPIMFYLPIKSEITAGKESFILSIFDVTPVYDHVALKMGIINNYFSTKHVLLFLENIVNVVNEIRQSGHNIKILLKHKRSFSKHHDKKYIEKCKDLAAKGLLELIEFDENIFSLIGRSSAVISFPYTSTAYIASHLEIPSLYYDPTNELEHSYESAKLLSMTSDGEEVKNWLLSLISS